MEEIWEKDKEKKGTRQESDCRWIFVMHARVFRLHPIFNNAPLRDFRRLEEG